MKTDTFTSNVINAKTEDSNAIIIENDFVNDATIGKYVEKAGLTYENNTFAKFKGNAIVNYPGYHGSNTYNEFIDWLNQNVK